jgi:hypothetical protein
MTSPGPSATAGRGAEPHAHPIRSELTTAISSPSSERRRARYLIQATIDARLGAAPLSPRTRRHTRVAAGDRFPADAGTPLGLHDALGVGGKQRSLVTAASPRSKRT